MANGEGSGLSNAGQQLLEFQCPKCAKKLKANRQVAGKRVKCPQCGQVVKVPGADPQAAVGDDDWLSLDIPAEAPQAAASAPKTSGPSTTSSHSKPATTASQPAAPAQKVTSSKSSSPAHTSVQRTTPQAVPAQPVKSGAVSPQLSPGGADVRKTAAERTVPSAPPATPSAPRSTGHKSTESQTRGSAPRRSVFDDDLPDLTAIGQTSANPASDDPGLVSLDGFSDQPAEPNLKLDRPVEDLGGLDDLGSIALVSPELDAQAQYRITCKNCDTPQYVTIAQKGQTIQCPDCFIRFVVPGPPLNWKPTKAASVDNWGKGTDVRLAPIEATGAQQEVERNRQRVTDILNKAQRELDDEIDEMVGTDFDTKGFIEKSLGFLMDPTTVMQLVLYGCYFALVFGVAQFCTARVQAGDKGFALILFGAIPTLTALVCLPMLSGGMALLESVANGRRRVAEWPSFNLFENLSDILLMGAALGIAMLIGLIAGGLIGRVVGSNWMILVCILGTTFLLFPVLLLSMLDNGSLFQPVSVQVFRSITGSAEAWGAYYLKTLFGFFCVQVAWFLLLNRHPIAAAAGGFLVPWLLFFVCQQIGSLAQAIAEHLSFEFASDDETQRS